MYSITVGEKELKIKFGYKPTLKAGLLRKLAKLEDNSFGDIERVEELMLFFPELILVGLQVYHKDEFGYDYNTNEGYDEQLDKVFDIVDEMSSDGNADFQEIYSGIQDELMNDGFLTSLFRQELAKVEQKNAKKTAKSKVEK